MVIWEKPHSLAYQMVKSSGTGFVVQNKILLWFLSFGLAIFGALLFMLPAIQLKGPPGIKNNHIFHSSATNRGWIAWFVFAFLISFYLVLYFRPSYMVNWIYQSTASCLSGLSVLTNGHHIYICISYVVECFNHFIARFAESQHESAIFRFEENCGWRNEILFWILDFVNL